MNSLMDQVREAVRTLSRSKPEFVAAHLTPLVRGATPIQIRWAIGALCNNGELHCVRERSSSAPRTYEVTPHLKQSASNLEAQRAAATELQAIVCGWYKQRTGRFENPYLEIEGL